MGAVMGGVVKKVFSIWGLQTNHDFIEGQRVMLLYDKSLDIPPQELLQMSESTLCEVEEYLQTPATLDKPFYARWILDKFLVYIGKSLTPMNEILSRQGKERGGFALRNGIAVTFEGPNQTRRVLRHEWTHVVSRVWNGSAHRFAQEGLAVAIQYADNPITLHKEATVYWYTSARMLIRRLINEESFFDDHEWGYYFYHFAGSFVRYLLDQYGLGCVRAWYQCTSSQEIKEAFFYVFNKPLILLEIEWLEHLRDLTKNSPYSETIQWEILKWHMESAIARKDLARVQELSRRARKQFPHRWLSALGEAWCLMRKGKYEKALKIVESALSLAQQSSVRDYSPLVLLQAKLYDGLGETSKAWEAYRHALKLPDDVFDTMSVHQQAQERIQQLTQQTK